MEVNVDMLEQMDLSDHESFDVFLLSGGEDNNAASPMLGMVHSPSHTLKQTAQSDHQIIRIYSRGQKFWEWHKY